MTVVIFDDTRTVRFFCFLLDNCFESDNFTCKAASVVGEGNALWSDLIGGTTLLAFVRLGISLLKLYQVYH